ncbi:ATP-grasp fold amidoligase family protein [Bacillus mycoides]|uniref:ATP-grasp fold amidoligase family protein n=1 Tax=Bacillus mycoides TaxID=1405 RepID=UPI00211194E7|nr:ATP-grasp fold amidoligase family protein [Bacillus mycoides]MCQ6526090.1 glycosyl transferase [Bacillus mycoides]
MNNFLRDTLRNNEFIVNLYDDLKRVYYEKCVTDEKLIKNEFQKKMGRNVNLENPTKFNDKLQWLKLNWFDSEATKCADKFGVRDFVKERIGGEYLNEIYKVYNSIDEINIDDLPNSFVLKGTHGSGFNIVCKDKSKLNWDEEFKKMKRWLRTNYYFQNREWVYRDIKPRIICEKFIEQGGEEELRDYRFFCFNGEPKFISVDFSINDKKKTRRNLYDLEWNLMDQEISYPKELAIKVNKPNKLNEMIDLSKKIASDFPHARIDFYYIQEKIIFGEITFFHQSGMGRIMPPEFEEEMGVWLELPNS